MNHLDLERLMAHELHEAEASETPVIKRVDYPDYIELSCGDVVICIFHKSLTDKLPMVMFDDVSVFRAAHDFDIAITLLQEAKRLMIERGTP